MSLFRNRRFRYAVCLLTFALAGFFCLRAHAEGQYPFMEVKGKFSSGYQQEFIYSDRMLLTDATAGVNPEIAKVAVSLAAAAYDPDLIESALEQMDFGCDTFQYYPRSMDFNDLVAYAIGTKKIEGTDKTAVIVAIRGTGKNAEWFSNFNVGADCTENEHLISQDDHRGFHRAAYDVWASLNAVVNTIDKQDRVILITGHSRGAAAANIVAHWANGISLAPQDQLFCYTFACPNVSRSVDPSSPEPNIHNFNITGDLVPIVPLKRWGYDRYGVTHDLIAPEALYRDFTGDDYTGASVTTHYEQALAAIAPTTDSLDDPLRQFLFMFIGYTLGGSEDVTLQDVINKYLKDNHGQLIQVALEKALPEDVSDMKDAFEAAGKLAQTNLELAYQLMEETEGMTQEEFEEHKEQKRHLYNELIAQTGIIIASTGDFHPVIEFLLNAIQYADEAGTLIGAFLFQLEDNGDALFFNAINDAHATPVYCCWVNQEYYGYRGRVKSSQGVILPEDVITVGPQCFYGSKAEGFHGVNVAYIPSDCFYNSGLKTLVIPNSIEHIGSGAFSGCDDLKSVRLPVEWSRFNLFLNCSNVETIEYTAQSSGVMPERAVQSGNEASHYTRTLEYACRDSVRKIIYNEGVTRIAGYANYHTGNSRLAEVVWPSTLREIGPYAFYSCGLPSLELPEGVETIGSSAFSYCSRLTSVVIPPTVATMDSYAFSYCAALKDLTFLNAVIGPSAFAHCTGLETLVIPSQITQIGSYAFAHCTGLTCVKLPVEQSGFTSFTDCRNVQTIEYTAQADGVMPERTYESTTETSHFSKTLEYACRESVRKIVYHEGVTRIAAYANYHTGNSKLAEVVWPSTLREIGPYAFYYCGLSSLELPEGVESIGFCAFSCCFNMASLTIPSTVATMDSFAFSYCTALKDLTFLNAVIGPYAFARCTGLETLVIPDGITWIGDYAFNQCTGLKNVKLPIEQSGFTTFTECSSVQTIEYTAQDTGVMPERTYESTTETSHFSKTLEYACRDSVRKIVYNEGVTRIAAYANYHTGSSRLAEVVWPSTLREIGPYAFYFCGLSSLELPEGVESIGSCAFSNCSRLTSVVIPSTVATMGTYAFHQCAALKDITFLNAVIGPYAFARCTGLETLVIPDGITWIGDYAFNQCTGLKNVKLPIEQSGFTTFSECWNVQTIEYTAQDTGVMPERTYESTTETSYYGKTLEYACRLSVKKMIFHEGVTQIAGYVNDHSSAVSKLTDVSFPSTLQKIGNRSFVNCTNLRFIGLGEHVEAIGASSFYNCSLTVLCAEGSWAHDWAVSRGFTVFTCCSEPELLTLAAAEPTCVAAGLTEGRVCGACGAVLSAQETIAAKGHQIMIEPLFETTQGETVEIACPLSCSGACGLGVHWAEASGAEGTPVVNDRVMVTCGTPGARALLFWIGEDTENAVTCHVIAHSIRQTVLPAALTALMDDAFAGSAVIEVIIPEGTESIGENAFAGCEDLALVTVPDSVVSIAPNAFAGSANVTLLCAEGSHAAQQAAQWEIPFLCP